MKHFKWKDYRDDLDELYEMALGKENLTAALKIKEMQAKAHKEELEQLEKFDPKHLSDDQIESLLMILSEHLEKLPPSQETQGPGLRCCDE